MRSIFTSLVETERWLESACTTFISKKGRNSSHPRSCFWISRRRRPGVSTKPEVLLFAVWSQGAIVHKLCWFQHCGFSALGHFIPCPPFLQSPCFSSWAATLDHDLGLSTEANQKSSCKHFWGERLTGWYYWRSEFLERTGRLTGDLETYMCSHVWKDVLTFKIPASHLYLLCIYSWTHIIGTWWYAN